MRTTKAAAIRLALELIPEHLDQIIGLSHDPELLHLDTGFTVLPNRVMLAAAGMFHSGFLIDRERAIHSIDPIAHAERLGFTIIRCDKADAIAHERCNLLPLGEGRYLAFDMPAELEAEIEDKAGVTVTCHARPRDRQGDRRGPLPDPAGLPLGQFVVTDVGRDIFVLELALAARERSGSEWMQGELGHVVAGAVCFHAFRKSPLMAARRSNSSSPSASELPGICAPSHSSTAISIRLFACASS